MYNAKNKSIIVNGYHMNYITFSRGNKWLTGVII